MSIRNLIISSAILLFMMGASETAECTELVVKRYALSENGNIEFRVPKKWSSPELAPTGGAHIPDIKFVSISDELEITITPILPTNKVISLPTPSELKSMVEGNASISGAHPNVEITTEVQEINGVSGMGYFYTANYNSTSAEERKHWAFGMIRVSDLSLIFTALSKPGFEQSVLESLNVFREAKHVQAIP